jgi:hypothetical protein
VSLDHSPSGVSQNRAKGPEVRSLESTGEGGRDLPCYTFTLMTPPGDRIEHAPAALGGKGVVRGTRIAVDGVLDWASRSSTSAGCSVTWR